MDREQLVLDGLLPVGDRHAIVAAGIGSVVDQDIDAPEGLHGVSTKRWTAATWRIQPWRRLCRTGQGLGRMVESGDNALRLLRLLNDRLFITASTWGGGTSSSIRIDRHREWAPCIVLTA